MKTKAEIQQWQDASTDNKANSDLSILRKMLLPTVTDAKKQLMKSFFEALPDDVRENVKIVKCVIKYVPEEDRIVPFIELEGK